MTIKWKVLDKKNLSAKSVFRYLQNKAPASRCEWILFVRIWLWSTVPAAVWKKNTEKRKHGPRYTKEESRTIILSIRTQLWFKSLQKIAAHSLEPRAASVYCWTIINCFRVHPILLEIYLIVLTDLAGQPISTLPVSLCTKLPQYMNNRKPNFHSLHSSVNRGSKWKPPRAVRKRESVAVKLSLPKQKPGVPGAVRVQGWATPVTRGTRSLLKGVTHLPTQAQPEFKWEVSSSNGKGQRTAISLALGNLLEGTGVWKGKKPPRPGGCGWVRVRGLSPREAQDPNTQGCWEPARQSSSKLIACTAKPKKEIHHARQEAQLLQSPSLFFLKIVPVIYIPRPWKSTPKIIFCYFILTWVLVLMK